MEFLVSLDLPLCDPQLIQLPSIHSGHLDSSFSHVPQQCLSKSCWYYLKSALTASNSLKHFLNLLLSTPQFLPSLSYQYRSLVLPSLAASSYSLHSSQTYPFKLSIPAYSSGFHHRITSKFSPWPWGLGIWTHYLSDLNTHPFPLDHYSLPIPASLLFLNHAQNGSCFRVLAFVVPTDWKSLRFLLSRFSHFV